MKKLLFLIIILTLTIVSGDENKSSLTVVVNGVKPGGTLYVSLFNQPDGYPTDPDKAYKKDMKKVSSKQERFVFKGIPFGTYAVSVWHDENDNGKMDTNLIGIPREGTGASNDAKGRMGPPRFPDASFKVESKTHSITINMNY